MKRARSTEGFTLFEMAIVILIMGSMAAMIAPGLSEWVADARASAAAEGLVRISRVVRARVNDTGLAHLFMFQATDDVDGAHELGTVRVWEGMNNHCNQTPWIQTIEGKPEDGHQIVDGMDLGSSEYNLPMDGEAPTASDTGRQVVRLTNNIDKSMLVLCFEPGGATYTGVSDGGSLAIGFRFTPQTAPVIFTVKRTTEGKDGPTRGIDREIVFPAGGNGRLRL